MKAWIAALALGLAVSCTAAAPDTSLTFNVSAVELDAKGTEVTFIAHTKTGTWTLEPSESWIHVTPSSGSGTVNVKVSATPNPRDEVRTAALNFSMPEGFNGIMALPVNQAAGDGSEGPDGPGGSDQPDGEATAVVITLAASGIGKTQATLSASFTGATGTIADRGFQYGTSRDALDRTAALNSTTGTSGTFSTSLSSLLPGTTYYFRAYVTEFDGENGKYVDRLGDVLSFTTLPNDGSITVKGLQYLGCYEIPAYSLANSDGASDSGGEESYAYGPWWRYDTTNENQAIITHAFKQNGRIIRNWTALIDKTKQAPLWSAFVMHKDVFPDKNLGRGSWHEDPAVPSDWQSCFASGNYHRGHLVASNYRQNCLDARNQTFLYTNQALQEQNGFNGSIWNSLENKVNGFRPSGRDTLYVVVGLLYETERIMDGKPAPSHFYKLLMKCSFDTGGTMTSAKGVAYLMENDVHSTSEYDNAKYRTSIDAIEERAGFDFFASVPKALQDEAEKQTAAIW